MASIKQLGHFGKHDMNIRIALGLLLAFISSVSMGAGFDENYEVRYGDYDNDGFQDDLYVRQKPQVVILHGEIATPIVTPADVKEFILVEDGSGDFDIESSLSSSQKWTYSQWPASNIELVLKDFNLDGYLDILLKGVGAHVAGAEDQMVFSDSNLGTPPISSVSISGNFQEFFQEVHNALSNPNYYDNAITETCYQNTGWYFRSWYWIAPVTIYDYEWNPVTIEQSGYYNSWAYVEAGTCFDSVDPSLITNLDAFNFSTELNDAIESGELDPSSNSASLFEEILGGIISAHFEPWESYEGLENDDNIISFDSLSNVINAVQIIFEYSDTNKDKSDIESLEAQRKADAEANVNQAWAQIIGDIRSGSLTIIEISESIIRDDDGDSESFDGFDSVTIEVVEHCKDEDGNPNTIATACTTFDGSYLFGQGVAEVTIMVVIDHAAESYGNAVQSIAHELRHLVKDNRDMDDSEPYYFSDKESDARQKGIAVRMHYDL